MAQGLLERVVNEAKAVAPVCISPNPLLFNQQIFGIEALSIQKITKHQFPSVSLNALCNYRTEDGWPSIVIFSLQSPTFSVEYDPEEDILSIHPRLQYPLWECFTDLKSPLKDHIRKNAKKTKHGYYRKVRISTQFNGLIPMEIKELALKAQPLFKDIYILAEQQEWSVDISRPIEIGDPLLVGWDGAALYLLAEFDTTPVEEAFLLEGPANKQK
jgi:hypothetical protein